MQIIPFHRDFIPQAANLFVRAYAEQRTLLPVLPQEMQDLARVAGMLEKLFSTCPGAAAVEGDSLLGYMGWYIVEGFRGTDRRAAYLPEWGHGCVDEKKDAIYRALYRYTSAQWQQSGCQAHAITLFAYDQIARDTWFWNGFGLTVVDAARPMRRLDTPITTSLRIRKAGMEDIDRLIALDAEHCAHYSAAPVFMTERKGKDRPGFAEFLSRPRNSIWIAEEGTKLAGFLQFDGYEYDCASILNAESCIVINAAFTRPAYRGLEAAAAMLDAALGDYAAQGLTCCGLDFESFNPEAAAFWMKYFTPACYSLVRVPEDSRG